MVCSLLTLCKTGYFGGYRASRFHRFLCAMKLQLAARIPQR
jgi:hypothetical protein